MWEEYLKVIPEGERDEMVSAYYRRLTSEDEQVRLEAAHAHFKRWARSKCLFSPSRALCNDASENLFSKLLLVAIRLWQGLQATFGRSRRE